MWGVRADYSSYFHNYIYSNKVTCKKAKRKRKKERKKEKELYMANRISTLFVLYF